MKAILGVVLAVLIIGGGIYFIKKDPQQEQPTDERDLFQVAPVDQLILTFQNTAKKANAIMVAFDTPADQQKECVKDQMQLSVASQETRATLDTLAIEILKAENFSELINGYIATCAQTCTCSVLSVFETNIQDNPDYALKYKDDLAKIQAAIEQSKNETQEARAACAAQIGDICELIK